MTDLLSPGDVVLETYTVERRLGSGAFADVYLVSHRFLGKQAMKVFCSRGEGSARDLLAEARLLVDLSHASIVRVYDANVLRAGEGTFPFVTMEWCPEGTLADWLAVEMTLPRGVVISVGLQICSALSFTHQLQPPLVHRDVKPANILVFDREGPPRVKLSDFGLATSLDPVTRLSQSGGTLAFAPPEMLWGVVDERGDVYSVGVTLYRALTGSHPFPILPRESVSATTEFRDMLSHGRRDIVPPSRMLMRSDASLDRVLTKALAFDPFDRYRNGAEFGEALQEAMRGPALS